MNSTSNTALGSSDRPVDIQKAEPILHDVLTRHQASLHPDSQKQIYDLYARAIEGNLDSIFQLSEHYHTGNGVFQDQYLAFRLVRFVAEGSASELLNCYNVGLERSQYYGSRFVTLPLLWQRRCRQKWSFQRQTTLPLPK
jgi:hypothetical protein